MGTLLKQQFFGLDISDSAIRIVALGEQRSKTRPRPLKSLGYQELPSGIISQGVIHHVDELSRHLKLCIQGVRGKKIKRDWAVVSLPEAKSFVHTFTLPHPNNALSLETINEGISKHIPYEIDELYFDWQPAETSSESSVITVGAAPRNVIDQYLHALHGADVAVLAFEPETVAIGRTLDTATRKNPIAIVDCGANRSTCSIIFGGCILLSATIPFAGNTVTNDIANQLKITSPEAEQLKVACSTKETCPAPAATIIVKHRSALIQSVKKHLDLFATTQEKTVDALVLTGGSSALMDLRSEMEKSLGIPCSLLEPVQRINQRGLALPTGKELSFTTAIGLALRSDIM